MTKDELLAAKKWITWQPTKIAVDDPVPQVVTIRKLIDQALDDRLVLLPREPTQEMLDETLCITSASGLIHTLFDESCYTQKQIWTAMLTAYENRALPGEKTL